MQKDVARDMEEFERFLLYGIGNQFKESYKLLKNKEIFLFDSNPQKWGTKYNGHLIHSPKEILKYINSKTGIMITSIKNQYEIAKKIVNEYNIPSEYILMYTSKWYEDHVYKSKDIEKNWDKVLNISEKLADEESKKYYLDAIIARKNRNPLLLQPNPKCVVTGEYGTIVCLEKGECIIDCGAYIGDTAEMYMERLNGECKIYAIEPYEKNFVEMQKRISHKNWEDKVIPYDCAVGRDVGETLINYNQGDFGMAINLSERKGKESQVVKIETLDHLFSDKKVSYVKMDIEGEERKALEGAKELIFLNCPKLMISGYHKIEDFWEIPETIWSINNNYKIYVGHSPGISTELEFYCIDDRK